MNPHTLSQLTAGMVNSSKAIAEVERNTFTIGRELIKHETNLDFIKRTIQLEIAHETIKNIKPNPDDEKNPFVIDTDKFRFTNENARTAELTRRLDVSADAREARRKIEQLRDQINLLNIETDVARRNYALQKIQYEFFVLGRRDGEKS